MYIVRKHRSCILDFFCKIETTQQTSQFYGLVVFVSIIEHVAEFMS